MMTLRRSARLTAASVSKNNSTTTTATSVPHLQPRTQTKRAASRTTNGVSKTRKPAAAARGKKAQLNANPKLDQASPLTDAPTASSSRSNNSRQSPNTTTTTTTTTTTNNIWDPIPTPSSRTTPPPLDRPVEPHHTNATLLTPHGSSLVAYPPGTDADASPSKTGRPRPTATTGTLLEQAAAHLIATDPRLESLIREHPCPLFTPEGLAEEIDPFRSLVSSIIGQQVSGAAAKSIKDKFVALFNTNNNKDEDGGTIRASFFPTPEDIIKKDITTLRTAGLSQRKAEYIHGLSEKFANGELSARMLLNASDEELVEKLTAVRGLGKWSVEMFACFALKRIDVFSTGDLGVQRGCAVFVGKDVNKLKGKGGGKFKYMPEKDMLELAAKFAPYRSLFMWYMWRVTDVNIAVLGG
ncbi:DNA-3-methyladenine glycosylase [Aspergillus costaricaensis CBS 115574]|uniref:DNA-3-methyladenine glycosylase n=1 Tax=Aspergillus costaricaensis CBS 115574 TaxID=1448317 RepID=A0ACD1I9B3_9EURO|nr:DNA-3-methyladenine glycosylase [Aspergillus costaricaensis CBS 115574]RAK86602.1 DNA-3-methyladenine glycosylase [Aspergillus costaricaensis CBS 115574]